MPMYAVPSQDSNTKKNAQNANKSFLATLFGIYEEKKEAPKQVDEETAKRLNLPKSLLSKVKPSFDISEFKYVSAKEDKYLIDGLPADQAAYGVQMFERKNVPRGYCDCDVCLGNEGKIVPIEMPDIQAINEEEEKKEEQVKDEKEEDRKERSCCECCCCCRHGCKRSKSRRRYQPIRLVVNVD